MCVDRLWVDMYHDAHHFGRCVNRLTYLNYIPNAHHSNFIGSYANWSRTAKFEKRGTN